MSRARLNLFIEPEHAHRLRQLATMKGLSQSAIVAAALASFLSPDGGDKREAAIARRLDKLTDQFGRLERDQTILIETLALFIRYYLSTEPQVAEAFQTAAREQGRVRFERFIDQLARHLQRGASLVRRVHEEIYPDESRFFGLTEDTPADAAEDTP